MNGLAEAFQQALRREHGWLLVPEVQEWDDFATASQKMKFTAADGTYVSYAVDSFLLKIANDPGRLLEKPFHLANQAVDTAWRDVWERATSGYMVRG